MSAAPDQAPIEPHSSWRPFQFSLRALLLLVTVVALAVGAVTVAPWLIQLLAMLLVWALLPTALVIVMIYARGTPRTFAIGALVPMVVWIVDRSTVARNSIVGWLAPPVFAACCGLIAVWLRRQIRQQGWDKPDDAAK